MKHMSKIRERVRKAIPNDIPKTAVLKKGIEIEINMINTTSLEGYFCRKIIYITS